MRNGVARHAATPRSDRVLLRPDPQATLVIDGREEGGWRVDSRWHRFVAYRRSLGSGAARREQLAILFTEEDEDPGVLRLFDEGALESRLVAIGAPDRLRLVGPEPEGGSAGAAADPGEEPQEEGLPGELLRGLGRTVADYLRLRVRATAGAGEEVNWLVSHRDVQALERLVGEAVRQWHRGRWAGPAKVTA